MNKNNSENGFRIVIANFYLTVTKKELVLTRIYNQRIKFLINWYWHKAKTRTRHSETENIPF